MTSRKYISHNIFIRTYNNHITILSIQPVFYPIANTAQPATENSPISQSSSSGWWCRCVNATGQTMQRTQCHASMHPMAGAHARLLGCTNEPDARVFTVWGGCVRARIGCSCESALRSRSRLATLEHLGTTKAIFKRAVKWIKVMMVAHHRNRTIRSNRFHTAYAVCLFVFN